MPKKTTDYINSWKQKCPDYEFVCWNESNFDINLNKFVKEAYDSKKWAFVSDVARLYALKKCGGIYLDTDVELVGNFDGFLNCLAFIGTERLKQDGMSQFSTATIGSVKEGQWVSQMLSSYQKRHFIKGDGTFDLTPNTVVLTSLTLGCNSMLDTNTLLDELSIFSSDYFSPKNFFTSHLKLTENTIAIHHFDGGWLPFHIKIKISIRRCLARMVN